MHRFEFQYSVISKSETYHRLQSFLKVSKIPQMYRYNIYIDTVSPLLFMAKLCLYKAITEEVPIDFLSKNKEIILKFSFFMCFDGSDYDEWEAYIWNNFLSSLS